MNNQEPHHFHIPVLGLAYSIDTPIKVARFGISSVISIMDDELIEDMRSYYCGQTGEDYVPIVSGEEDHRAKRITAYLNLAHCLVKQQVTALRQLPFDTGNELVKYFELLPDHSPIKEKFNAMTGLHECPEKHKLQDELRTLVQAGSIDVNIMSKIDKVNFGPGGNALAPEYSDAMAALRGFAQSDLCAAVIFSAGYNPGLYNYLTQFPDFYPDQQGILRKKIILKVSDFRSALVQGKILAKKGLWVSEFRIESGLNCGGHAFATDGLLMGPILETFKQQRAALTQELLDLCRAAHAEKECPTFPTTPALRVTAQGGIGTAGEQAFLIDHYALDATGWGSPFLLVPEATNVDEQTLQALSVAKQEDYYLSDASPLGVPFNNFRNSSAEAQRLERMRKGRPGSPCVKEFLASDTEFTAQPICTASRKYQYLKLKQLQERGLDAASYEAEYKRITDKDCLCEGLGASVRLKDQMPLSHKLSAVTICPGPNLSFFSGIFSLLQMTDHIYGRDNLLNDTYRPNLFINELQLYVRHFRNKITTSVERNARQLKGLHTFKVNLQEGINYYKELLLHFTKETSQYLKTMASELDSATLELARLESTYTEVV